MDAVEERVPRAVLAQTIAAEAVRGTEELLAVDLAAREEPAERVDYLRHQRDDLGVRAPTPATGGSA